MSAGNPLPVSWRTCRTAIVKSFPALTEGFEIETEITVHALELGLRISEITAPYKERPEGSVSKLNTYRDGIRILHLILLLLKAERPFRFFAALSALVFLGTAGLAAPLAVTYIETGLVPRLPTAILVTGLSIVGLLTLMSGIILETVTRGRREAKREEKRTERRRRWPKAWRGSDEGCQNSRNVSGGDGDGYEAEEQESERERRGTG